MCILDIEQIRDFAEFPPLPRPYRSKGSMNDRSVNGYLEPPLYTAVKTSSPPKQRVTALHVRSPPQESKSVETIGHPDFLESEHQH